MGFLEFYKKGQGSAARLIAIVAGFLLVATGCYSLWVTLQGSQTLSKTLLPIPHVGLEVTLALLIALVVLVTGCLALAWFVNRPRSVDLLIETEGEMRKVSWPSRQEAWNSSVIVVVTVLVMMGLLFFYDFALNFILKRLFLGGRA
ncbi:MAG: preprotein translocase subunit SecE [Planctomycetota bacterium]|jgi:preprotein translocase subunit SecE